MSFSENKVLAERSITFETIVKNLNTSPCVKKMMSDDYGLLFKFVLAIITDYLNYAHPQLVGAANTLSADLIEKNQTFKAEDFINMFKYFRQNPEDTNLNMTPERIIKRVEEYELKKSDALEQYHASKKGQLSEENKTPLAAKVLEKFTKHADKDLVINDFGMGKEFDRVKADNERTGKNAYVAGNPNEKYFTK